MPKQSSKKPDFAQNALRIVEASIGGPLKQPEEKNPAAVALGRLGGLKGGKVRAQTLTAEQRKAIAKVAAARRWKNKPVKMKDETGG